MGMFCLNMLGIAIELAMTEPAYEDIAIKFFDHFLYIAQALNGLGHNGVPLWDEEDGFFYDVVRAPDGSVRKLKVRSLVGLIPLLAVETIEPSVLARLPSFAARFRWFADNRPDLVGMVSRFNESGPGRYTTGRPTNVTCWLCCVRQRMKAVLRYMLDPNEFLSDHGVRSLSRFHLDHPYSDAFGGEEWSIRLRAGRVRDGRVWRQFQLARSYLVSAQLPAHRVAAEVPSLLRRRLPGGVSNRLGPAVTAGRRARPVDALDLDVPAERSTANDPSLATSQLFQRIRTGPTTCRSMSIFTGTRAAAWAPATRPAGPPWWPNSSISGRATPRSSGSARSAA